MMIRITSMLFIATICLHGCGSGSSSSSLGQGKATVSILDQTWSLSGQCEKPGDDLTFVAPGDPMLTIGINTATDSNPVGNFSSAGQGFGVLIGTADAPIPKVERSGSSFTVAGTFKALDASSIEGTISVDCKL